MRNALFFLAAVAGSLLGWAFYFGLLGFVFMLGWNFVMPDVFGAPNLTLVQSAVILALASLLYWVVSPKEQPKAYVVQMKEKKE